MGAWTRQHQRASAVVVLAGSRSDFVGLRNGNRGAVSLHDCVQPARAARLLLDIRVGQITPNVDLWKSTMLADNIFYRLSKSKRTWPLPASTSQNLTCGQRTSEI